MIRDFPLSYTQASLAEKAHDLMQHYGFVLTDHQFPRLQLSPAGLELCLEGFLPLKVDFSRALQGRKLDQSHALIRACKPSSGMRVMDATGGWGADAALLARFGAEIVMIERQAIMAALLSDGLDRLKGRLPISLLHVDAVNYLQTLKEEAYPDLIYIDPMHPNRQKSALVKKDMQALQQLFGADDDAEALIALALTRARSKVVVKWPQRLKALIKPNQSIEGKTVRFDVYECRKIEVYSP